MTMKNNNGQLSLFEDDEFLQQDDLTDKIKITRVQYINQENLTLHELFKDYQELKVITYSYGLKFIEKLMHKFKRGEVILGCSKLVNSELAQLMANQEFVINEVGKNPYLQDRIANDEFKFYVSNDLLSH